MKSAIIAVLVLALFGNGVINPIANSDTPAIKAFPSVPRHMLDSTVIVKTGLGHGSGVCIGDRLFLTACHVVMRDDGKMSKDIEIEIHTAKHKGSGFVDAKVVAHDKDRDVAILQTDTPHVSVAVLGHEGSIRIGDALFAVGAPGFASKNTASLGYLAATENSGAETEDSLLWQSSNAVFFGNSGGPIFDANTGFLVGIAVQGTGDKRSGYAPNCCFFVCLDIVRSLLKDVK